MTKQTVFAGQSLARLILAGLFFFQLSTRAANLTFAWSLSSSPTATGYSVYYGLASGGYTWSINAGDATNLTVTNLTVGTTYYFAVQAHDNSGDVSPFSSEITNTIAGGAPPVITMQPPSQAVSYDARVLIPAVASSTSPMTFQWFCNNGALEGATKMFLVLSNVTVSSSGSYTLVVSNSSGSVASAPAVLSVWPPVDQVSLNLIGGSGAQLLFTGTPGDTYILQAATNLSASGHWQSIATNTAAASGAVSFLDTNALKMPARFYRSMLE